MTHLPLNQRIRDFYDRSTGLWLQTWGEHMHHGYYGPDGRERKDHRQAQEDLIRELLRWGGAGSATRILDAGCGVGGSARFLARHFGAAALGVTLSPVQARAGTQMTREAGLSDRVSIEVRDLMTLTPADGPFDLIWSLESAEHIADKAAMIQQFHELLAPGGRLLLATWCHRATPPPLRPDEKRLLERIYRIYHLPPMNSTPDYEALARQAGFEQVETGDWSAAVAPFWQAVIYSALDWRNAALLLRTHWSTIRGAWAMRYMRRGYREGLIRFAVLQGRKD